MSTNIDFGSIPNIGEKLNAAEVVEMNRVFNDPEVQSHLEAIESQRKARSNKRWAVTKQMSLIAILLCVVLSIFGLYLDVLPSMLVLLVFFYIGRLVFIDLTFAKTIEIPLKSQVLSKICPILSSRLIYSPRVMSNKYTQELSVLQNIGFINQYDTIELMEDNIEFQMRDATRGSFILEGFEFVTSKKDITRDENNQYEEHTVITNHEYLTKVFFPNARVDIIADIKITHSQQAQGNMSSFWLSMIAILFMAFFCFTLLASVFDSLLAAFSITAVISLGVITAMHLHDKRMNINRVELENIEFEKLFDVQCEDQVTSRMILTPAFMARVVSFVQKTGNQYEFLFQRNTLYIKRKIIGQYLEVGTEKNILANLSGFVQFYCDMREILLFAHEMNLMYFSKTDNSAPLADLPYHVSSPDCLLRS